jgi:hypothetical protein
MPAAGLPFDRDDLDPPFDGPVLVNADVADALEVDAGTAGSGQRLSRP